MLLVKLTIGKEEYAVESSCIKEIIPSVKLKNIPCCEDYILGAINYHGLPVPVIDINMLCNESETKNILTTRIIIIECGYSNILGIKAENVTETIRIDEDSLQRRSNNQRYTSLLGPVFEVNNSLIQILESDKILSKRAHDDLFNRTNDTSLTGEIL